MFFNGQVLYRRRGERGEQFKFLSPAAVAEAFRRAPFDTGHLPPGVFRCGQTARGDFAALFVPAARHTLSVEGQRGGKVSPLAVWLPPLVFFGLGGHFRVWAVKPDTPQASALLHHAPLPNVFADARICWGQNAPPAASAQTVREAWRLFITSPFNGHAASDKVKGCKGDVRPYLRTLARSNRKFPASALLPMNRYGNTTLDAALTALIQGGGE